MDEIEAAALALCPVLCCDLTPLFAFFIISFSSGVMVRSLSVTRFWGSSMRSRAMFARIRLSRRICFAAS